MNKRKEITADVMTKRMLTSLEAENYTSLGRTKLREWGEKIGAVKKIGSRILYDRTIIDLELSKRDA